MAPDLLTDFELMILLSIGWGIRPERVRLHGRLAGVTDGD